MANNKIPTVVADYMKKYSCNYSELIATIEGEDVFSLGKADDDGFVLPIGLPIFVLVKGGKSRIIEGEDALLFASTSLVDK